MCLRSHAHRAVADPNSALSWGNPQGCAASKAKGFELVQFIHFRALFQRARKGYYGAHRGCLVNPWWPSATAARGQAAAIDRSSDCDVDTQPKMPPCALIMARPAT